MADMKIQRLGGGPWVTRLGNAWNSSVSLVNATAQGVPLRSVSLPERAAQGISVAEDGRIFVAGENNLTAIGSDAVEWSVETRPFATPVVLTDGRLITWEKSNLAIRDQATGKPMGALPAGGWTTPAITHDGHVVYRRYLGNKVHLQKVGLSGELVWSRPLTRRSIDPPLALPELIVIGDGSYCRAFNQQGVLQWRVNRNGFRLENGSTESKAAIMAEGADEEVRTPIVWLGHDLLLAGLSWSRGYGFYIFDIGAYTVRPLGVHLPLGEPLAVPHLQSTGSCLVTVAWPEEDEYGSLRSGVIMVDLQGNVLWTHRTAIKPHAIVADVMAKVFLACSPSFGRWEKYRHWPQYDLEKECFLRCLGPDGQELFTWYAPGPISEPLAIGLGGELLLVSEGQLWAIG